MDNKAEDLAREIVQARKKIIAHWADIDYYTQHGIERAKDEKYLTPHVDDLTRCEVRDICLTYPSWLTKQKGLIAKAKGPKKEELQRDYDIKREALLRVKAMKDDE